MPLTSASTQSMQFDAHLLPRTLVHLYCLLAASMEKVLCVFDGGLVCPIL